VVHTYTNADIVTLLRVPVSCFSGSYQGANKGLYDFVVVGLTSAGVKSWAWQVRKPPYPAHMPRRQYITWMYQVQSVKCAQRVERRHLSAEAGSATDACWSPRALPPRSNAASLLKCNSAFPIAHARSLAYRVRCGTAPPSPISSTRSHAAARARTSSEV
jgi:hypothetical protein